MRLLLVSHLLVLLSVVSLIRAQTTSAATSSTAETPTIPATTSETPTIPATTSETPTVPATTSETPTVPATTSETPTIPATTSETPTVPANTSETPTIPATTSAIAQTAAEPWRAPDIFYPFGSAAGDTEIVDTGSESYSSVSLSTPFQFFGRKYNQIHVNYNGLLTFNIPLLASEPYYNPTRGIEDFIAALWNDFDDYYSGVFSYQEYTNGSVLARATQDINQYFPQKNFTASWVFVVTWKYGPQQRPVNLFQVVLISDGNLSFFLMNYGDCAQLQGRVQAGYDTINSTNYFEIPDSSNGNYQNLKNTSNVNLPGRWAFIANSQLKSIIGVRMKLMSFSDLTQSENTEAVMQIIQQELVSRGLSSSVKMKLRKVKKTQP